MESALGGLSWMLEDLEAGYYQQHRWHFQWQQLPRWYRWSSKKQHWHKPPKGWYKFNIDGAFNGNNCQGGIGGVARNNTESWILGFHMKVPTISATQVELQALRGCLQIIMQHNLMPVKIETDASEIIHMLDNDHPTYTKLIYECRWLMKQTKRKGQVVLRHSFRHGNEVAHDLAKMALMQPNINKMSLLATPPEPAIQQYQ
uniref:RNase H type-1 domain-containing protein n=1 Tax=Nicotiana tabacum TaxID=4097 RepID=A0A1S4B9V7_TOBAC|nr:PREDICTED: uncharacterized protein LOC107806020 [Nicotiana tabacum]